MHNSRPINEHLLKVLLLLGGCMRMGVYIISKCSCTTYSPSYSRTFRAKHTTADTSPRCKTFHCLFSPIRNPIPPLTIHF